METGVVENYSDVTGNGIIRPDRRLGGGKNVFFSDGCIKGGPLSHMVGRRVQFTLQQNQGQLIAPIVEFII